MNGFKVRQVQEADIPQIERLLRVNSRDFDPPFTRKAIGIEIGQIRRFGTALVAVNEAGTILGYVRYGHSRVRIPMLKQIARENRQMARRGEKPTGAYKGELGRSKRHGYIFTILTAREARGQGIGTELVRIAEGKIKSMRYRNRRLVRSILMTRHERNLGTAAIAERLGYKIFGAVPTAGREKAKQTLVYGKILKRR